MLGRNGETEEEMNERETSNPNLRILIGPSALLTRSTLPQPIGSHWFFFLPVAHLVDPHDDGSGRQALPE